MKAADNSKPKKKPRARSYREIQAELDGISDIHFHQVTGKVIDSIRYTSESAGGNLVIDFDDKTALIIDYRPHLRCTMEADYSDWETGVPLKSKRWKKVSHSME